MIKIVVVTGTRADYGIYYPILKEIDKDFELDLHLIVTGMHLKAEYGDTEHFIEKDGFRISARVENLQEDSTHANMAKSVGLAVLGMTQAMEDISPDCVLVLGDRGEMLAAAIVSSHMNIPLIHLHGGEVSGTIDESVRHAISKLAHIHLTATEGSRERLIKLGEDPWRIHVVGAPRIETILNATLPSLESTKLNYSLNFIGSYILFIYHPVTTERQNIYKLKQLFEVLIATKMSIVCVMPNSDAGAEDILELYHQFSGHQGIFMVKSFEQLDYLTMLKHATILVGNSSSGIIEAASYRIPVINIGTRQWGRERSANIIDIDENGDQLSNAIKYVLSDDFQEDLKVITNVYEKSGTSSATIQILKELVFSKQLIQKTITY
ncbi:UDP-N,N'-diacetylbacillosamine 2-epimerase (hydrolyzing) [compost metagenome]